MRLDLREIINLPGKSVKFDYQPDMDGLEFDSVNRFLSPVKAVGEIVNIAGVLTLNAEIEADLECVCARCLKEFDKHIRLHTEAIIVEEAQDEDNPDIFFLDGDYMDVDEVIVTAFILNMEQRFLCSEDCKGLCDKCGKNLNDGPCGCKAETDPRLAVLGQLLEKD